MKELIKQIRQYTELSQAEMATKIGVQFASVNRWENGHTQPTHLAQDGLFALCEQYDVPVYQMIVDRVKAEIAALNIAPDRTVLYHGSKSGLVGDITPSSRARCDFGKGFYMGTTPEQPLTLICDFEEAKFYVVSVDMSDLNTLEVATDIDWAMLVAYHRGKMEGIKGTEFYNKYSTMTANKDIAIGSIADDKMFYVLDNFFLENITDVALVNSLSALQLGKQYVALTPKACAAVKVEKEIPISYLEKKVLKKVSEENRQKGIELANKICKSHRREGKYFDEILDEATRGDK